MGWWIGRLWSPWGGPPGGGFGKSRKYFKGKTDVRLRDWGWVGWGGGPFWAMGRLLVTYVGVPRSCSEGSFGVIGPNADDSPVFGGV